MLLKKLKVAAVLVCLAVAAGLGIGLPSVPGTEGRAAAQGPGEPDGLRETLLALEKRLWAAADEQDTRELDRLLAEDFVSFSQLGRYTKRDALAATRRVRCVGLVAEGVEVIRVSKDAALVSYIGRWRVLNDAGGLQEECANRRVTDCWARRQGTWVLVCCQEVQMPEGKGR